LLKEAAYGIGCTTWEVVRHVVFPYAAVGVIAASCLASAAPWRNHGGYLS